MLYLKVGQNYKLYLNQLNVIHVDSASVGGACVALQHEAPEHVCVVG